MATYDAGPYGSRPAWQEVLQLPYTTIDTGGADRRRALWQTRADQMKAAQDAELAALNAALQSQRDKQLADLAAQDAARRAGSGGGGGGGGGGSAPASLLPVTPAPTSDWYSQLASLYGDPTPPPTYTPTYPSQVDPTHSAWYLTDAQKIATAKGAPNKVKLARNPPKAPGVSTSTPSYSSRQGSVAASKPKPLPKYSTRLS